MTIIGDPTICVDEEHYSGVENGVTRSPSAEQAGAMTPHAPTFVPPAGADLTARPLTLDDAAAVVALTRADEAEVLPEPLTELEDVRRVWRQPGFEPAARSLGLLVGEELIGYALIREHGRLEAVVSGSHRGRGIGRALLSWVRAATQALGESEVSQTVPVGSPAHDFLLAAGARAEYEAWTLELPPGAVLAEQPLPPGYSLGVGRPEEMPAAHRVIEDAFNEWPGRRPVDFAAWSADYLQGGDSTAWRCRVVRDPAGAVVGVAMLFPSEDGMLWVDELAVAAGHRGLGLARSLLADSFAVGRSRGLARAGLSTDSRTGALGLYEHVGMQTTATFSHLVIAAGPGHRWPAGA